MVSRRGFFALLLLLVLALPARAGFADVDDVTADNVQEGDNDSDDEQSGDADTGDAVGGQVVGVVSSGDTRVDATNRSEDVDVTSGDARGANVIDSFVGQLAVPATATAADIDNVDSFNVQEGDNEDSSSQDFSGSSGDAVAGQVTGVVTSSGGSADLVLANTSRNVDLETGDVEFGNEFDGITGLVAIEPPPAPPAPPPPPPAPVFILNVSDATAVEGDALNFIVTLTRVVTAADQVTASDTTFHANTSDGTATAGGEGQGANDYSSTSGTFTIHDGQSSTTVSVPTFVDICGENPEMMELHITDASGAEIGDGTGVGTIVDSNASC